MGGYVDYIKDFPNRILELYKTSLALAESNGFEVTLLISLTASGIAVPLDRLCPDPMNKRQYPDPFEDRNEFKKAAEKFDGLYAKPFRESELWDPMFEDWRYGKCHSGTTDPDSCGAFSSALTVEDVIIHLRHSLAHGVIFTDVDEKEKIKQIRLFTGKKEKVLKVLCVTPKSLEKFLYKWVEWLKTLDVFH